MDIKKLVRQKLNEMEKRLDFVAKEKYAKKLTISQLEFAIKDCIECYQKGIDPDYYKDEISVYKMELRRRNKKGIKEGLDEAKSQTYKLLASGPSEEGIIKSISQYYMGSTIHLEKISDNTFSVHNKNGLIKGVSVTVKNGKFKFQRD